MDMSNIAIIQIALNNKNIKFKNPVYLNNLQCGGYDIVEEGYGFFGNKDYKIGEYFISDYIAEYRMKNLEQAKILDEYLKKNPVYKTRVVYDP